MPATAYGDLRDIGQQIVRNAVGIFADAPARMRADRVEVAQGRGDRGLRIAEIVGDYEPVAGFGEGDAGVRADVAKAAGDEDRSLFARHKFLSSLRAQWSTRSCQ